MGALGDEDDDLHVILNMADDALGFELPKIERRGWWRVIDTALPTPDDIAEPGEGQFVDGNDYIATGRSVVVLSSRPVTT